MGGSVSKLMAKIFAHKEMRILMLGLDAAGKTTILYRLKLDDSDVVTTIPTVGFNVETVTYKNTRFNVWDVGGQDKIRPLWRHYYTGTHAVIFVVDCNDRDRIEEAREELKRIVQDREIRNATILIFANKIDIKGGIAPKEMETQLELKTNIPPGMLWKIQPTIATDGQGIFEGLGWLSENVKVDK